MNRLLPLLVLISVPLAFVAPAFAPAPAAHGQAYSRRSEVSREDSIGAHRAARSQQSAFERVRRANLPWAWGGGRGECDERIGRFCLTYSRNDDTEWEPPPEKPAVTNARERLLGELIGAAATIPGDRWVVGQLVRYLVEAGRFEEARQIAAACRAERWWCDAVQGFAAHHAGDSEVAHLAFGHMLLQMPPEERREWSDLSMILPPQVARRYRRLEEVDRRHFETRFWTIADPLFQIPGNQLRSEHLSRALLVELQDRAETTENLRWGADLQEILLRFGIPSGWEQIRNPYYLHRQEMSLLSHYPDADLDLLPPDELLAADFVPTAGRWDEDGRRARASYPLPRAGERLRWFIEIPHQLAMFQSGNSALIVAAYELADSVPEEAPFDAALGVLAAADTAARITLQTTAGRAGVLSLEVPHEAMLLSLEVVSADRARAGRVRLGVEPRPLIPGVLSVSDLLLVHAATDTVSASRADAVAQARGSTRFRPGERVGIYWEMYSPAVPWPPSMQLSLRLIAARTGWLRRLGERAGVVKELQPIRITWGESMVGEGPIARSLTLQIPEDTPVGDYRLELSLLAAGREPLVVERAIQVVP